ncbi:hypothetical protein PVK06_027219 [Gossypium arboreum]|uniref:Uncharacterized protein n=1 Tax=Gossypium arboreum TaxID=29729 RepID=A0ABR0NZR9_GOSAR|nr:hypothetical protein PVK06_027219 [Gossypium arboreum]
MDDPSIPLKQEEELSLPRRVEEGKSEKKKVGIALKSTTIEDSESSEEVDEDKKMTLSDRRFKKFMRSNKGRNVQ